MKEMPDLLSFNILLTRYLDRTDIELKFIYDASWTFFSLGILMGVGNEDSAYPSKQINSWILAQFSNKSQAWFSDKMKLFFCIIC